MADIELFPFLIIADRRVALTQHFSFLDQDYTGSSFKMQVREVKDTTGTPLIDAGSGTGISLLYSGTATVAAHVAAGRLPSDVYEFVNPATDAPYVGTDNLTLSQIGLGIGAATIAGLPFPIERGDDWPGWYDIIRIPAVGDPEIILAGKFIVRAGVTIP